MGSWNDKKKVMTHNKTLGKKRRENNGNDKKQGEGIQGEGGKCEGKIHENVE